MIKKNSSENEYTMQILAALTSKVIAKKLKISDIQAFDTFIKSRTAEILFDEKYLLWHDGPDYIANEYFLEINFQHS